MVSMVVLSFSCDNRFKGLGDERFVAHARDIAGAVPSRFNPLDKILTICITYIFNLFLGAAAEYTQPSQQSDVRHLQTQAGTKFGESQRWKAGVIQGPSVARAGSRSQTATDIYAGGHSGQPLRSVPSHPTSPRRSLAAPPQIVPCTAPQVSITRRTFITLFLI
jgi:hypothetical protein